MQHAVQARIPFVGRMFSSPRRTLSIELLPAPAQHWDCHDEDRTHCQRLWTLWQHEIATGWKCFLMLQDMSQVSKSLTCKGRYQGLTGESWLLICSKQPVFMKVADAKTVQLGGSWNGLHSFKEMQNIQQ